MLTVKTAIFLAYFLYVCTGIMNAQVTTATLSGIVKDSKGAPMPGATVTVEYPDAGIKQTLVTKSDGRFTVPLLRVGGPYKVTVNYVSYQPAVTEKSSLNLD